jgi:hypothetical protein
VVNVREVVDLGGLEVAGRRRGIAAVSLPYGDLSAGNVRASVEGEGVKVLAVRAEGNGFTVSLPLSAAEAPYGVTLSDRAGKRVYGRGAPIVNGRGGPFKGRSRGSSGCCAGADDGGGSSASAFSYLRDCAAAPFASWGGASTPEGRPFGKPWPASWRRVRTCRVGRACPCGAASVNAKRAGEVQDWGRCEAGRRRAELTACR